MKQVHNNIHTCKKHTCKEHTRKDKKKRSKCRVPNVAIATPIAMMRVVRVVQYECDQCK